MESVRKSVWHDLSAEAMKRRPSPSALAFAVIVTASFFAASIQAQTFGCSPAMANDIVCENSKPGSNPNNWLITGNGDSSIQGFATDISVAQGGTISFKIDTTASAYTIDIYRQGYYQGNGARFITSLSPTAKLPQTQPACLTNAATSLYDCGNWAVSGSWQVPANATSGIYFALLTRTDTGGDSQIFFIVRNDSSHSAIYYQTSDETWQAYNTYGGDGLYGGPTTWNLPIRSYKVSYNRPFITRTFNEESATWVYGAEYPMVRFLEANGYDVTYFTGIDAERNGGLILNHKIYISSGHDEYVSSNQRANVEAARNAGVNLAFFSGNEVFWKTRWENSIDGTNTPYRTLVCYKETLDGTSSGGIPDPEDPPTWTGTWRDPRFSPPADGGRPENELTGTLFMVNGDGPDNPGNLQIQVPQADGAMRFWRNTSLAKLTSGQTGMLPQGTLGYEWDEDIDNGSRPAGLFHLSTATYTLTLDLLLDYGATYGAGTATHHMTLYRAPSGALVFGAGTIQFAWGLDANHDNPFTSVLSTNPPADPDMQQATVNLFADMGVQPATLIGGLVLAVPSTDTTPPTSVITLPVQAAVEQLGVTLTITGTASDAGGGVVGGVEVSTDGGMTWHPANGRGSWTYTWTPLTAGSIQLLSRAVDDSGNLETPSQGVTVNVPRPPISIDTQASKDGSTASSTISTSAFSTSASNELLLAFISTDYVSGSNTTVTGVSGAGLTWALVARTNAQSGTSEIWRAFAPSQLNSVTVTATLSQSVSSSMTVVTFIGVNTSGTNGSGAIGATKSGSASSGAPTAALVTTGNNSLVIGVGNDFDNATARTPAAGQNVLHQYLTSTGDTYWVQMESAAVFVSGTTVTISDTAPTTDRYNLTICEILASSAQSTQTGGISGIISPNAAGSGAQVILSGPVSASTTATGTGAYSFSNLTNGIYTVTPNHSGYTFSPPNQSVTVSGSNQGSINFTGTAVPTFTVSGNVGPPTSGSGTTLTLSATVAGGSTQTTTADGSGNFTFTGVANGTYTLTPTKAGFTFTPTSLPETVNGANLTGATFTAIPPGTLSISGTITPKSGGAGATVTLSGSATGTTLADANGNYSFTALSSGSYTVTPAQIGYAYTPTNQPVILSGTNQTGINFTAQPTASWSISGTIGSGGGGCSGCSYVQSTHSSETGNTDWPTLLNVKAGDALVYIGQFSNFTPGATVNMTDSHGNTWYRCDNNATTDFVEVQDQTAYGMSCHYAVNVAAWPTITAQPVASQCVSTSCSEVGGTFFELALPANAKAVAWATPHTGTSTSGSNNVSCGSITLTQADDFLLCDFDNASGNPTAGTTPVSFTMDETIVTAIETGLYPGTGTITPTGTLDSSGIAYTSITVAFGAGGSGGGAGATVALTGTSSATTVADANGNYSFTALTNGSYTVTPSETGYIFTPPNQPVTLNSASQTGVNFTLQAGTSWSISGTISPTAGGAGATVTLSGTSSATTAADANGNYSFTGLVNGPYTVTPSKTGYTFTPPNQSVTVNGANLTTVNFTAQATGSFSISGTISPLSSGVGVTVTLSGTSSATTTTNGSGTYTFSGLVNGPYTVTPSFAGLTFSPSSLPETVNGANITANFTVATYSLSGTITPASLGNGATVALSGTSTATTTANASGVYTFSGLANGSYTVTPSKTGLTFSPVNLPETINGASLSNANFTVPSFTISGTISPASLSTGATVTLSGAASATTTADGSGNYSFAGLLNGGYTVTPSKTGLTFSPANLPETVNGANITLANFAVQTYSISGTITSGGGATVTLSGKASATTTADGSGNYSFTGLVNGSYTVTPSKSGFTFSPTSLNETVSGSNITGAGFTAQAVQASSLAIDAKVSKDGTAASTTLATSAFSTTTSNELLLAFVSTDYVSGTNTTVTGITGAGLTWVLVLRTNTQSGTAEIWRAFAPSALTNVTVTATISHSVVSSMTVVTFKGANATGTNGSGAIGATKSANAKPGAPSASLVTTQNGSWVIGVGNDFDKASARTLGAGQTLVHQDLASAGDTYWVQMQTSPTPLSGTTVTINDTAPATDRYNLSICEILPAN